MRPSVTADIPIATSHSRRPRRAAFEWAPPVIKRAMDVVGALVLLGLLLPLLVGIALSVWWSSPGPILFRQERVGKNGRIFCLYKFRTMLPDADPAIHRTYYTQFIRGTAHQFGDTFKLVTDPRLTPIGRILRHYSLDELPQLVNVVRGEMSLVGPRPAIAYEVAEYTPRELGRLAATPGLTGLWQVSGRNLLAFHEMIELDLHYIEQWSLWLDIRILLRTPFVVLSGRGAS
jgi:lipopolysaccharide/colanic/teichoic acid biosynthesis glycosyltransferase